MVLPSEGKPNYKIHHKNSSQLYCFYIIFILSNSYKADLGLFILLLFLFILDLHKRVTEMSS